MNIIICAGGTGGHLYPALSLADYIKKQDNKVNILFVGSKYRLEAQKVCEHGYDFIGLNIATPGPNVFSKIKAYSQMFYKVLECKKIIKDFNPNVIIGFGGYTAYSMLRAGLSLKIPTIIHEQNSVLGKSNLVLAKKVNYLISAYPQIAKQSKTDNVKILGNPTSYQVVSKNKADLQKYGLTLDKKTILIVMGSQGSMSVDKHMQNFIKNDLNPDYQYIYITGKNYYHNYDDIKLAANIKVLEYENNLVSLIKACDLIVSRAGASAITEIMACHKAAILIPSKYVTNNHQYKNAQALVDKNAVYIIEENNDLNLNLKNKIDEILNDQKKYTKLLANTKQFAFENSAQKIYDLIKEVAGNVSNR